MNLEGIAFFIVDKMSAYVVGGSSLQTAAKFTRGELEAIYKGNHHSRDESGAWQITLPPEALSIDAAMRKADKAIAEILRVCKEDKENGQPSNRSTHSPGANTLNGFDKLAEYARQTT